MNAYIEHHISVFQSDGPKVNFHKPELLTVYHKYLTEGLVIALLLHIILSIGYYAKVNFFSTDSETDRDISQRVLTMVDLNTPPPLQEVPPVEIQEMAVALKDLSALTPEPVAKKYVKEEVILKNQQELEKVTLPVASTGTDDPSKVNPNAIFTGKVEEKKVEEKVVKKEEKKKVDYKEFEVEKAPVAVNLQQIKSMMKYPEIARESGIEGRVIVKVLVNTDGSIIRIGGISGPEIFHEEVSEKIMELQFTPALMDGKPVKCWVSVPFSFKLSK